MIRRRAIGLATTALALLSACHHETRRAGDPKRGAILVTRQACGSCHRIPGIQQADGSVGPPLAHFASRTMIQGMLPNTPGNAIRFIRSPRTVVGESVMPDQNLSDAQLRDVVAYLETLK